MSKTERTHLVINGGSTRARPVIVIDADITFLKSLLSDPKARSIPPVTVETGRIAQLTLADEQREFSGIFVNPNIDRPYGLSVVRFAHRHRPAVPVYLIHDGEAQPFTDAELKGLTIQKAMPKPVSYTDMVEMIGPAAMGFNASLALEQSEHNADRINVELTTEDAGFLPIRAENFLSGTKCFFDVYVRLASGRYVMILRAGDVFAPDRVVQYLKRGVAHFYLRKEMQEHYLSYCDHLSAALLKNPRVPVSLKVSQTLNHGEETISFLRAHGVSEARLQHANHFIQNVTELVKQLDPIKNPILRTFLDDVETYEHGVATSMIASLIVNVSDIDADKSVQVIGLAALLHDIGMYRVLPELRHEDESLMSIEQRALYRAHTRLGVEILKGIRGIDPTVMQAVGQHHERRNKRGFPGMIGIGAINRVAEIIGIGDEFVRALSAAKRDPAKNPFEEMSRSFDGFSFPVADAFRKVFLKKP